MEKKKKKTKYQPLDISMTVVQSSWADDESATFGGISEVTAIREKLPSAPKAVRNAYDVTQLPSQGPWKAHISNLPFNVKEEDVIKFLGNESDIEELNIPTAGGRARGFAVATFVSREALAAVMEKNDDMLLNRRITISLSNDSERGRYGDRDNAWGGRRDDNRRPPRDDDDSDWRSMAMQSREDTIGRPERPGPSNGDWNRGPPRRNWQDDDSRSGSRPSRFEGSRPSYDRERGDRYDDRERGDRDGPTRDRGGDRDWEGARVRERPEGAWGRDRDSGDRDRGVHDRDRDRGVHDRDRDRGGPDRDRDRGGPDRDRDRDYGRERRSERSDAPRERNDATRERPRLNLQPRSKPAETTENGESVRPSSIFGAAKPVDTAAREREIETRLERERRDVDTSGRRRTSDREELPPPSEKGTFVGRPRKTSDSSGKHRNSSLGSSSGGGGGGSVSGGGGSSLPLRQNSADISPASPPARAPKDNSSDSARRQRVLPSTVPNEEDDVFSQGDSRQRRASTTSSNARDQENHQQPPQQAQSTLVDAPPPSVNVWQVRRNQMQRRVAEAVAESSVPTPRSVSSSNSHASAASHGPPLAPAAPAPVEEKKPVPQEATPAEIEARSEPVSERTEAPVADSAASPEACEPVEKAASGPPTQTQPPRRTPVVVSVVAAQRAAAEGQPPPPPIRENAWGQSHGAMEAVRRPPSPSRMPTGPPSQSYPAERGYSSFSQGHPGDWSEGGQRMPRGDYRDGSGGYRGSSYRGSRGGSWRGRGGGGGGGRGGSGYRGRGGRGGGGYRYPNSGEANTADM